MGDWERGYFSAYHVNLLKEQAEDGSSPEFHFSFRIYIVQDRVSQCIHSLNNKDFWSLSCCLLTITFLMAEWARLAVDVATLEKFT